MAFKPKMEAVWFFRVLSGWWFNFLKLFHTLKNMTVDFPGCHFTMAWTHFSRKSLGRMVTDSGLVQTGHMLLLNQLLWPKGWSKFSSDELRICSSLWSGVGMSRVCYWSETTSPRVWELAQGTLWQENAADRSSCIEFSLLEIYWKK